MSGSEPERPKVERGLNQSPTVPSTPVMDSASLAVRADHLSSVTSTTTQADDDHDLVAASSTELRENQYLDREVYTALYSGVEVLEMMVAGVAVMRRRKDSSLNATQILKVAGVDKSRRSKVLEREILTGTHEKVQGGYGKYQGTWVPYERGLGLCRQFDVYETLQPLLEPDVSAEFPSKDQVLAAKRRFLAFASPSASVSQAQGQSSPSAQANVPAPASSIPTFSVAFSGSLPRTAADKVSDDTLHETEQHLAKKMRLSEPETTADLPFLALDEDLPRLTVPREPLQEESSGGDELLFERLDASKELITQMFVDDRFSQDESEASIPSNVIVDVPIDDLGHAALHWAAALSRVSFVKALVARGADRLRGNYSGESALVRAVLVTNAYDTAQFGPLLNILYPALYLLDRQGRSVLHHIAITAGIRGRADASKYYLECLLEWVVRKGKLVATRTQRYSLRRFMAELVNVQDRNGDTALNIAARVGNRSIAQMLLDVNADPELANRAGLRPIDFGIGRGSVGLGLSGVENGVASVVSDKQDKDKSNENSDNNDNGTNPDQADGPAPEAAPNYSEQLQTAHQEIARLLSFADEQFQTELEAKKAAVAQWRAQLKEASAVLTQRRQRLQEVKAVANRAAELQRSAKNLDRAIEVHKRALAVQDVGPVMDLEGQSVSTLQTLVEAHTQGKVQLQAQIQVIQDQSLALENKFRRVVATSTGVAEGQVDAILQSLVQEVENDPADRGRQDGER